MDSILLFICKIIFLPFSLNICHRNDYFEYRQHMFWIRNKNNNFQLHTLVWRTVYCFQNLVDRIKKYLKFCLLNFPVIDLEHEIYPAHKY